MAACRSIYLAVYLLVKLALATHAIVSYCDF